MKKHELVGKKVLIKPGANEDLKKYGFYTEDMKEYEGKTGIVKQYLDFGSSSNSNHIVGFPDGVQWSYHEEFLEYLPE